MSGCLSDEQLERLAADTLPPAEAAELRAHLEDCSTCREEFEECRANYQFETVVRSALGTAEAGPRRTERPPERPPEQIRGYDIQEEIHRGAQGVIYKGVQQTTGRQVAIKFLRDGSYASESSRRRFEREIEVAARLVHANIIRVFDSGVTASGRDYYVMDYVEGLPLHHYVWDRKLTARQAIELFVVVCGAVNFAHQRGVIHRDLKPSNILVDATGSPRILDFGLAKQVLSQPETMISLTGQVMGTLPFMSPEQAAGGREQIDIRADVYALGVILFLILTGRYPYPVSGPITEVLNHIATTPPTSPRKAWSPGSGVKEDDEVRGRRRSPSPIDEDVETIILKALAKEPERRYQNVAMLTEDLSRYLHGQPIEARRDVGLIVLRRKLTRYKAVTALSVLCVGLVGISAQTFWWMYEAQSRERERYEMERARAVEAQVQLATVVMKLGDSAMDQGDHEEALGQYLAALTIQQHLVASDRNNLDYQEELAWTLLRVADVLRERGERVKAADYCRQAQRLVEQLVEREPVKKAYADLLREARRRMQGLPTQPEADRGPSGANQRKDKPQ